MIDVAAAYQEVADRFASTVLGLSNEEAGTPVRSCPAWTVHDVLAHHVGAVVDVVSGNAPEVPDGVDFLRDFDEVIGTVFADLSARQVTERASRTVADILAEWEPATPAMWAMLRGEVRTSGFPIEPAIAQGVMINDVVVHEGDVRQALGLPPAPETPALSLSLGNYALMASLHLRKAGLGALRLEYDGREKVIGTGEPVATLRGTRNDLVRTLASRRSRDQILAMDWDGDPAGFADLLPAYGVVDPADADLLTG